MPDTIAPDSICYYSEGTGRGFSNASDDLAAYFDATTGKSTGNTVSITQVIAAPQLYQSSGVVASFAGLLRIKNAVDDHLSGRTPQYRCEFSLCGKNGAWIWYANYGKVMDGDSDTPDRRSIGVTFNIDDRKRKEDEIAQINRQLAEQNALLQSCNAALELLAACDSLTGLANRRTLMELGVKECKRAERFTVPAFWPNRCATLWLHSVCLRTMKVPKSFLPSASAWPPWRAPPCPSRN